MVEMSPQERELTSRLLTLAADEFSVHGSNDFAVPNTDANWTLYQTVERWAQGDDPVYVRSRPPWGKPIVFHDAILMRYFAARLSGET